MKPDARKLPLGRWAGYLLYGLLASLGFLYLLFPFTRLERFAIARITAATALQIDPQERRVGFPLNVEWRTVRVTNLNATKGIGLQGDQVSLRFAVLPLLERKVSADFHFGFLGGEVAGVAQWLGNTKPYAYFVRGTARDLTLTSFQADAVAARVRAQWEYRWDSTDILKGQGQGTVEASDVAFKAVLAGMPPMAFRRLTARVLLNNGIVTVEDMRGEGDDGAVRGGGTVILRDEVSESLVNIALELRPREGSSSHLVIKGPVRSPSVFVNGVLIPLPDTSL